MAKSPSKIKTADDEIAFEEIDPFWMYGPGGAAKIFTSLSDVPEGWQDHPSKVEEPKVEDL